VLVKKPKPKVVVVVIVVVKAKSDDMSGKTENFHHHRKIHYSGIPFFQSGMSSLSSYHYHYHYHCFLLIFHFLFAITGANEVQ